MPNLPVGSGRRGFFLPISASPVTVGGAFSAILTLDSGIGRRHLARPCGMPAACASIKRELSCEGYRHIALNLTWPRQPSPRKPGKRPDGSSMVNKIDRVHRLIIVFAVTVFWTVTLSAIAWAIPCSPPKSAAKASLQLDLGDPQYVYDLDTEGIRKVISDIQGYVAGPWHLPLGLAVAELGTRFEIKLFIRKSRTPGYCVALAEAKVTVGYTDLTVYISSNYAEGSCEFDAILAHEREHLQINQDVLEDYKAKFREMLRQVLRFKKVIFVHRKTEARAAYILHLQSRLKPLLAEMRGGLARKNGAIDTEENYRRVLAQCDNWLDVDLEAAGSKTGSRQNELPISPTS